MLFRSRAGFMAVAYLLVYTVQRKGEPLNIFALVLFFILFFSPEMIYSAGFHMSAGAILGITLFYKPIRNFFKNLFKINNIVYDKVINSFSITFAVSLIVSPIVAYYFNVFSIISPYSSFFTSQQCLYETSEQSPSKRGLSGFQTKSATLFNEFSLSIS